MPKADKGPTRNRTSGQSDRPENEASGRYPSDEEWESTLERAESTKQEHDSLFRRLAGKEE